jgi:hypothetical protein
VKSARAGAQLVEGFEKIGATKAAKSLQSEPFQRYEADESAVLVQVRSAQHSDDCRAAARSLGELRARVLASIPAPRDW